MKSCLPIIASLFLAATPFIPPVVALETEVIAQNIDPYIKDNIAREITVKISSKENGGSGVIIARQEKNYLVLTNNHVLRQEREFTIKTHDGETYAAKPITDAIESNDDLAILQFSSDKSYQTATINSAATPREEQDILAVGYDTKTGELVTQAGTIELIPDKTLKDGYSIGYSSNIVQGMSGGAILNANGEVIGINGKSAFPIVDTGYRYRDGSEPTAAEIEQYRKLSWGLSLNRFLTQLNPEIIKAYNLPLPETTAAVETAYTGWLGELEAKAKQITVRIDSSIGANGSGVIIAKEGNTYTVLTTAHVVCERKNATQPCKKVTYEILAPDGNKYAVDAKTIKRQDGVDLAVVKFNSNEIYQIAKLANYPLKKDDLVFVAGYPRLSSNTSAEWLFSYGYGLSRVQGLIDVTDNKLSDNDLFTKDSEMTISSDSLAGGYEMVYTNITYSGMSGGAVLDKDGRVIGIHGAAEGETNLAGSSTKKIQLGNSLGIPINTFIGLADRLEVKKELPIQNNRPRELNTAEILIFSEAILGTKISQGNAKAEIWIERGDRLRRIRHFDEAVKAFDRAIALNPEFIHLAHFGKGLVLWKQGKKEAVLASLELAIETQSDFAPAYLFKSSILNQLNRGNEALVAINQAISIEPNDSNLYNLKGIILFDLERYSEAETVFSQAIKIDARSYFYKSRGSLYYRQGKLDLALKDFNQVIKIDPNNADNLLLRGLLYKEQGKLDLALNDFSQVIKIDPNDANAYFERSYIYAKQDKLDLAEADLDQAVKLNSNNARVYIVRGLWYEKQGNLNLAEDNYKRAIKINPNSTQGFYFRGVLYAGQRKFNLALSDFNQVIKLNPSHADAYKERGLLYDEQGKLDLALSDFNQLIKLKPKYSLAFSGRGFLYMKKEKSDLALADYNKAIELDPDHAKNYYVRGLLYLVRGKVELALTDFNRLIALDPKDANGYFNRGLIYKDKGQIEKAKLDWQKAYELFIAQKDIANAEKVASALDKLATRPNYSIAESVEQNSPQSAEEYFSRGLTYQKQGKLDLALNDYNKIIALEPNSAKAYINRGNLYFKQGNLDLAEADLNQAIKLDPKDAKHFFLRALLYEKQGKLDLALKDFNQVISLNPDSAEAYYHRGLIYYNQTKLELGITDLNQAIKLDPNYALAYRLRGALYLLQRQIEKAKFDFQKAEELFIAQGRIADAKKVANTLQESTTRPSYPITESAEQNSPRSAEAYFNRGFTYYQQGKLDLALKDFNQAISINPNDARAYGNRGLIYQKQGKFDLALANYNQVISIHPNDALAYLNRGTLYQEQGKLDFAFVDYNQALKLNPNLAQAYYNRGALYHKQGQIEKAKLDWQKAYELFIAQGNIEAAEKVAEVLKTLE